MSPCPKCNEKMIKQHKFDKLPRVATFHLKKFMNYGEFVIKTTDQVEFPLELDLRPYMSSNHNPEVSRNYTLYAFVVHIGSSMTSGHYITYVRSAPKTWHQFDNRTVKRINETCVLKQNAYISFYAQEETSWFSEVTSHFPFAETSQQRQLQACRATDNIDDTTLTNVGEAPAGVILDHLSMEGNKVNLSTVLDDKITREADVSEVVNGSGNKETEEFKSEKGEATKTSLVVEDSKIVKEKASETEKQVHEPESFNKSIEDAKIISSHDVTLEKEKEDNLTRKPEEVSVEKPVIEEDQVETKHSQEQEEEIDNIFKAREEIPIKTDEVKEETDSRTVETSVNGTEAEHNPMVSVEEISRNGVNIVNETVPEKETEIDSEPLHEIETITKPEAEKEEDKEEMKIDEQPRLNAIEKVGTETVKTVIEDSEIVNKEEPTVQESQSLKENEEPVEAMKNSDDAEQTSSEVTVDREKNEAITQNTEEVQESPRVIETPTIQGEDIESKASLEVDKISKDTEEHENVLVRDIPQGETLVTEAETVDTSTVQDAGILKTNINETEAMHSATGVEEDGQETKENTKPSQDMKEDKEEEEETDTVKTIMTSDEVRSSDVQAEVFGEHTEPCSSEIKDESQGRENSVEVESTEDLLDVPSTESEKNQDNEPETTLVADTESREKSTETFQEKSTEDLLDVPSTESEKNQDNEPETTLVADSESRGKFEKSPSDLALNVDKEELKDEMTNVDQVNGTQIMEEHRGLDSNGTEAEQIDRNRTDETEEIQVALPDVEPVEQMQRPILESPSEVSEESSKTVDETIGKKQEEEEVTPHQEGQEEGSYGLETKEETVSVPKSSELREERNVIDLNPLQEESSQQNEQDKETKLEKHEPIDEEVKSDEVTQVSSASPSNELEGETVVEAGKIENIKENEEEQAADKIPKSLETVESHGSLPSSSVEHEHGTVSENIEDEKVEAEQTRDIGLPLTEKCSMDQTQPEEQVKEACSRDEQENEISKNSENIVNETYALHSAEVAEEETATNGESLNDVESTKRVLLEVEKEEEAEMKTAEEPRLDAIEKEEIGTVKTIVEDAKIVNNEETAAHESESLKGDDAVEEVEESPQVIETPTVQGEDIESKASLELKEEVDQSSKDTEEHVLGRDIPQCVDTSTAQEAAVLTTLETNINEAEDKEQKETETVKDVSFSHEVTPSDQVDAQAEEFDEHTEACSSEVKDESQGQDESVEVNYKESVQDESSEEKDVNLLDVRSGESEKYQDNEPETSLVSKTESRDKFEDIPSAVEGSGLDEPLHKQTLVDVESVEKVQKPHLDTPSEPSEETSTTVYEKVEDSPKEEEVTLHQEGQEEVTVSVPESKNLGEQAEEEESCLPNEKENETKLQKEKIEEYEPTLEEVSNDQQSPAEEKSDEVIQVSSASLSEGPEGETVEAKKIGDKNIDEEEQVEPHSSLPSSLEEQEHGTISEKTDNGNGKETTYIVALPLEEQEKVTSTEKGETKANETEDDKPDEHVDSSTSPMLSEKNDEEALTAEEKKEDEEITVGTLNTSENVCMKQEEFGKLETPKLEESKEDKSQEIAETIKEIEATSDQTLPIEASQIDTIPSSELVSEQEDQTPKQVEEIHEEEAKEAQKVEATGDRNLPVETSQAANTLSSELASELDDQTLKQVEEIHEEETKEAHKLNSEEILPTEIISRDSSDGPLASMLASKEDGQVTLQVDNCGEDIREAKDTQEEQPISAEPEKSEGETKPKEPEDEKVETPTSPIISEKSDNETLIVETKKEDEDMDEIEKPMALESSGTSKKSENVGIKQEQFGNHEQVPKQEESKDEKSQEITETAEAIEATGDQTLPIETSQVDHNLSSELVSGLDDQTPRKVEEIHEEEVKEERKFEATCEKSLPVETSQECQTPSSDLASGPEDQTPKQVEEVHEEETKEEHKLQVACDKILPVETLQEDQIPKQIEEILEEETKETHQVQAEDILSTETFPRESFTEASGEDEPVTPQEGRCTSDTQEEQHVSAETGERVEEPKLIKLPKVEDESAKKTDVEVAELTNDYPTEEAEHGDETYSTLPVVGILTELQTTLESERSVNDFASSGENMIKEPADQVQKKGDVEVESNEDFLSKIIEANRLQQDQSGETEKIQEENGLEGKSLPIEELNLQEEDKEEVQVQDDISRAFEVSAKEKLQKEEIREIAEKQEESKPQQDASLQEEHPRDFDISKQVGDNSDQVMESELPSDKPQTEQKTEIHETVKEEDQIVDFKEVKKSEDVHDEKLEGLSATTGTEETSSSQVKKAQEDAGELGVGHDIASPQVEPHSALEINEVVTSEKQITDPVVIIKKAEHESNVEHIQPQAISDDTESNSDSVLTTEEAPKDQREEVSADKSVTKEALDEQIQVPSSALLDDQDLSVEKPSELIQPHQSPNQVEETSFEVKKAQEDITEETVDALITNENVQVQDQPKDFEAPAKEKETSEHKKSDDLTHVQEDISTNVKVEVRDDKIRGDGHDSVAELKEETGLTEEKRELDNVKTELEDAIKHEVFVEEKNNTSENIDGEATKEINQEESKQTYAVKEEIREEEKETNQESFNNLKKTNEAIDKTQPEISEIKSLSSVSKTHEKSEQKDEVSKLENPNIAEELQQKDRESENNKGLYSEVKETEPTLKEPARKSLSDLIQKVKGTTNTTEDATTTEPHIEEESKTEEEEDDGDHEQNKDDKTSPDSLVMVEAKDTVSIIKTHKKSHGILSQVKHSISKVKKVLTGKSSHTTKPSSPT